MGANIHVSVSLSCRVSLTSTSFLSSVKVVFLLSLLPTHATLAFLPEKDEPMGEEVPDWAPMWGAKVKMPTDMKDDMLRDAIETSRQALDECGDFEAEGLRLHESCILGRAVAV